MGIQKLNSFIRDKCKDSIRLINFTELADKKIAVDISIYIYKFLREDALIENIYLMLATFRHYNIIPIFIFDGKPPTEKKELLKKRKELKLNSEIEYNKLKEELKQIEETINTNGDENGDENGDGNGDGNCILLEMYKKDVVNAMTILKKQCINIKLKTIEDVKLLIIAYGATYYDAPGEADELCALLVIKEKVFACLSDDMDMFVYGCPIILRYLSLTKQNVILYDMKGILVELGVTQKEFREICVLSGTDYNIHNDEEIILYKILSLFKKYHKLRLNIEFYDWLIENNSKYMNNNNMLLNAKHIYNMFDIEGTEISNINLNLMEIANSPIMKDELRQILENDGFIYAT